MNQSDNLKIAIVKWDNHDGISEAIQYEFVSLGYEVESFRFDQDVPERVNLVFSFAPYGRFLHIPKALAKIPRGERPMFIHWNFESLPNINLPWPILSSLGHFRSWIDRLNDSENDWVRQLVQKGPLSILNRKMHKFRYLGDYHYAGRKGYMDLFCDSSKIFAQLHNAHGLSAAYIPWGTSRKWYSDLNLIRDIDVLWMGKWRTSRRRKLLMQLRHQLTQRGINMLMVDNIEHPFIFGEVRTKYLNRAKITINILPTWYDPAFPFRFHLAAANKSLVVSEPLPPHTPIYQPAKHYVATPLRSMADTVQYYLEHEAERTQIAENAYQLVTKQLTLANSIGNIMELVDLNGRAN